MAHSLQITDEESKTQLIEDLSVARFRNVGKKYFHNNFTDSKNYLKLLTNSSKFLSFSLPPNINEVFIKFEEAHYFWALITPLNTFLREHYKQEYIDRNSPEIQSSIRNIYTRWVNARTKEESKHFAALLINTLKKHQGNDIYNVLLHSIVLTYEKCFFDYEVATELLEKANEYAESGNFEQYTVEIKYLIKVFDGFAALKNELMTKANEKFHEALILKPQGITALFYHGLTDIQLKNTNNLSSKLQPIYEFDLERIKFSMGTNNLSVFNYFLKNNIISNFFECNDLSHLSEEFEMFFSEQKFEKESKLNCIAKEFNAFLQLRLDELGEEDVVNNITFVQKIIQSDSVHKNILFFSSIDLIERKFRDIVKLIYEKIVAKHYIDIDNSIKYFDEETGRLKEKMEKLSRDGSSTKEKIIKTSKQTIEQIEGNISRSIYFLENKLNNLNLDNKNNPIYSFKNSMTYSLVISLLISLVAGLANYSNGSTKDAAELQNTFALFIVPGIKWGAIAFLFGFLVSVFSSFSSWMERSTQKQRIVQRISFLKNDKDRQLSVVNKRMETDLKNAADDVKAMIEEYEYQIEKLSQDKLQREEELKSEADERVKKEAEKIIEFLPKK